MASAPLHPLQLRILAEDLIRRRRASDDVRSAATQRQGRTDPNPHQIDAVIFALQRIPLGGCILGDEVGLGKTIEAGLVISQLMAEGKRRVVVIAPKPLLGQWMNELYDHFGLVAREGTADAGGFEGDGIFLIGREFAGSDRGSNALIAAERFDLCVIDEAHEIFAGIHRRFDRGGVYREQADVAVIAHRVREALGDTPKLLLTATPIQNSLAELWGLVQYIEPTGTLLGDLGTFRALFTDGNDGALFVDQAHELQRRLRSVVRRTLRRQAEEFLEQPFVRRQARLYEYTMGPDERALYEDVTSYLLEPWLCAFRGQERRLLLLGFHRRMASSLPALAKSLRGVEERLVAMSRRDPLHERGGLLEAASDLDEELAEFAQDFDEDAPNVEVAEPKVAGRVERELARVRSLRERAEGIETDSKANALVAAVKVIFERGEAHGGSGKVVLFTESLTTQDYLASRLVAERIVAPGDVTLFRGTNDSERAMEALATWEREIGIDLPASRRPAPSIAVRLALVHEFKTRSNVFISTEAGGKGLNLQFCENLINYDLPWNPQRIEQRIGRCHRYGQTRDVTVINFLARDNEAERLLFDILGRKLELFGRLLDASDVVLHEPGGAPPELLASAVGAHFESSLRRVYDRARNAEEVIRGMEQLALEITHDRESYESALRRTDGLIESHLDQSVRRHFRGIQERLPDALARFDRDLARFMAGYFTSLGVEYRVDASDRFELPPNPLLPSEYVDGGRFVIGDGVTPHDDEEPDGGERLHLAHPLVMSAIAHAQTLGDQETMAFHVERESDLGKWTGRRGLLVVSKLTHVGVEVEERLRITLLFEGDEEPIDEEVARSLLASVATRSAPLDPPLRIVSRQLDDAIEEGLFRDRLAISAAEREGVVGILHQIDRAVEDRVLVMRQTRKQLQQRFDTARDARDSAVSSEARRRAERILSELQGELDRVDAELARLDSRDDDLYQKTRARAQARRYAPPQVARIVATEFHVVGPLGGS